MTLAELYRPVGHKLIPSPMPLCPYAPMPSEEDLTIIVFEPHLLIISFSQLNLFENKSKRDG